MQDKVIAEDIVQKVFTVFWGKGKGLDLKAPLAAYPYKLTRNKILDLVKHTTVDPPISDQTRVGLYCIYCKRCTA